MIRLIFTKWQLDHWGAELQLIKTIEELSEVQKEIADVLLCLATHDEPDIDHLAEEIADVEIMLTQLKKLQWSSRNVGELVQEHKVMKLERLVRLVGGEC